MTKRRPLLTAKGVMSEHHNCIDCGINTMPGCATREQVDNRLRAGALRAGADTVVTMVFGEHTECYLVKAKVWEAAAMEGYGGCLCIGCLEQRLGRQLRPKDFVRIRVDQPGRWPKTERRMLGIVTGAAVKLAPPRNGELVIAEGVETALAAMKLKIGPAWALGSAGQLSFLPVIPGIRHLILAEEADETSRAAVKLCARRWRRAGRKTSIVSSEFGNNLNDAVIELAKAATQ